MKVSIIIPYLGKFPPSFPLFLKSCEFNNDYNWILLTDNTDNYSFPVNVNRINITFEELRQLIQKKFDYKLCLKDPYKLCDFKVAYGYIFSDLLKDSDWWGFSDCDLVYGKLSDFLTEDIFSYYDKIFTTGHIALFKNNLKVNRCFMDDYEGINYAKHVFTSPKIFGFDEMIINELFLQNGLKIYTEDLSANISVYYYKYRLVKRNFNLKRYMTEDYTPAHYEWKNGKLKRNYFSEDDGRNIENEFAYIHFQQRPLYIYNQDASKFEFLPNCINGEEVRKKVKFMDMKLVFHTFANRIRYKVKRRLSFLFHGRFTRGNYL